MKNGSSFLWKNPYGLFGQPNILEGLEFTRSGAVLDFSEGRTPGKVVLAVLLGVNELYW